MVFRLREHIPFYAFEILGGSLFGRVNIYFSHICPLQLNPSTLNRWQRCDFLWVKTWKISGSMAGISDVPLYLKIIHTRLTSTCLRLGNPQQSVSILFILPRNPPGPCFWVSGC